MTDPQQQMPRKPNRWLIIIGAVLGLLALYYIAITVIGVKKADEPLQQNPTASPEDAATNRAQQTTSHVDRILQPAPASIVDTSLLTKPTPENETLAREEVSSLEDQQAQLVEKKTSLEQQLKDSDKLVELKAKYLADLQAQVEQNNV